MTKDQALERARYLLQAVLVGNQAGKLPAAIRDRNTGDTLDERIARFLAAMEEGYEDELPDIHDIRRELPCYRTLARQEEEETLPDPTPPEAA